MVSNGPTPPKVRVAPLVIDGPLDRCVDRVSGTTQEISGSLGVESGGIPIPSGLQTADTRGMELVVEPLVETLLNPIAIGAAVAAAATLVSGVPARIVDLWEEHSPV